MHNFVSGRCLDDFTARIRQIRADRLSRYVIPATSPASVSPRIAVPPQIRCSDTRGASFLLILQRLSHSARRFRRPAGSV